MAGKAPESLVVSVVTRSALGQKSKRSEVADTVCAVELLAGKTLLRRVGEFAHVHDIDPIGVGMHMNEQVDAGRETILHRRRFCRAVLRSGKG
jgi:hypothetical protein